jgi:hypothetical protein
MFSAAKNKKFGFWGKDQGLLGKFRKLFLVQIAGCWLFACVQGKLD